MMWFQPSLRSKHLVDIPVIMSSLVQLPAITACFGPHHEIVIMTANSLTLTPMKALLKTECGITECRTKSQIQILGCEEVEGFEAVAKGEKVDVAKVTPHMVELVQTHCEKFPNTRAVLMECTELAQFADAVKQATGLPVYDPITACKYMLMGHEFHAFAPPLSPETQA